MKINGAKYQQKEDQQPKNKLAHFLSQRSKYSSLYSSENRQKYMIKASSKGFLSHGNKLIIVFISIIQIFSANKLVECIPYLFFHMILTGSLTEQSEFMKKIGIIINDLVFIIFLSLNQSTFIFLIINHLIYLMKYYSSYLEFQKHLRIMFFEIIIACSLKGIYLNFFSYFIQGSIILALFYIIACFQFKNFLYFFQMKIHLKDIIKTLNKMPYSLFVSDEKTSLLVGNTKFLSMLQKFCNIHSTQNFLIKNIFEEYESIVFNKLHYLPANNNGKEKFRGRIEKSLLKNQSTIPEFLKINLFSSNGHREMWFGWMKIESDRIIKTKFNSKMNVQILDIINELVGISDKNSFILMNRTKQYDVELLIERLKFLIYFVDNTQTFSNETFNINNLILTIINLYFKGSNSLFCKFYYKNKLEFSGKVYACIDLIRSLLIAIFDMIIILCQKGHIIKIESYLHETLPNDFVIRFTFIFDIRDSKIYPFLNKYFKSSFKSKKICKNLKGIPSQYYNELFRFFLIKSLVQAHSNIVFTVGPLL